MGITAELIDYDGKSVERLEAVQKRYAPDDEVLSELVRLSIHGEENPAIGASWLLHAWLSTGASLPRKATGELTDGLGELPGHWVRLHVCRLVPDLALTSAQAAAWAAFLDSCRREERPFHRAWATDGLVRLASGHPQHADRARRAVEDALTDPAASVRARARRILAE